MKIVADDKIPFLKGLLEPIADMVYLPGNKFTNKEIADADALLVRTRTQCNTELLSGSNVRFIGTATIGFDHIDTQFCKENAIFWTNAPGCNADSVVQYIISSLFYLSIKNHFSLQGKTIGIVGVGNVGKRVEDACCKLGMTILLNDPPRAELEPGFVDLQTIASECDIISFHTPLTFSEKYPTFHLANESFFSLLKKQPIFCNSGRGEVVDSKALKHAFDNKLISEMVIDCWENEPDIDRDILSKATIATPHIAGYSTDGKMNATRMILSSLSDFFKLNIDLSSLKLPPLEKDKIDLDSFLDNRIENTILKTYNPMDDCIPLKKTPENFELFRGNYGLRREYPAYTIYNATKEEIQLLEKLGFKIV